MVVKQRWFGTLYDLMFESRVILDGSQPFCYYRSPTLEFESRVILDGSQTVPPQGGQ